jgi:hypothetical protein
MTTLKNLAVAAASLVIFSNITHAQTLKASYTVNANDAFKVKYIGDEGEYLVFEVTLDVPKTSNAVFSIYDKSEGELYSSYYAGSAATKTIKIEKTNNSQVLDFKMTVGKKAFSKSFAANTSVVETINVTETSVTKL